MTTVTKSRPCVKPTRSIRLALRPFEGNPGVVDITVGKETTSYFLRPLASDFGLAFELEKFGTQGGETYHVNLDGQQSTCECKGFLRWHRCKHVSGIQKLVEVGLLPARRPVKQSA